jgi:hypothetical protein
LLIKHTAILLPAIFLAYAVLWWLIRPEWTKEARGPLAPLWAARLGHVALAAGMVFLALWMSTGCEIRQRQEPMILDNYWASDSAYHEVPWPAASYFDSFASGTGHERGGRPGFLFGEHRNDAWWYYFPILATYRIPVGVALIVLLALLSLLWMPPRWDEWALLIPLVSYALTLIISRMNIGFRHAFPSYLFLLLLASRCVAVGGAGWLIGAAAGLLATAGHAVSYHPDYLCYLNWPRPRAYFDISESNVDWGQGLKQVAEWIDRHPQPGRPIYLAYFGPPRIHLEHYLGDRVLPLRKDQPLPANGVLIVSPVFLVGVYEDTDRFQKLWQIEPDAVIGHSLLVFDLDKLAQGSDGG